jgi:hypothetical protein
MLARQNISAQGLRKLQSARDGLLFKRTTATPNTGANGLSRGQGIHAPDPVLVSGINRLFHYFKRSLCEIVQKNSQLRDIREI